MQVGPPLCHASTLMASTAPTPVIWAKEPAMLPVYPSIRAPPGTPHVTQMA